MPPLPHALSPRRAAAQIYVGVVAAARAPFFYEHLAVPDTVEGRYEMIVLHLILALRRLRDPPAGQRRLAQALMDYMAADLDRSIRELGVGDLGVARFMKRLGEGVYGRAAAYDAALDNNDKAALTRALLRNLYAGVEPEGRILAMIADYVERQWEHLRAQPIDGLARGSIDFLAPTNAVCDAD
jgi:cytochrome b pre-mRNA-processing protein 3